MRAIHQPMKPNLKLFQARLFCAVVLGTGLSFSLAAATFSDANWTTVGSGMNGTVYALAVSGSDLYAGGGFTTAGGNPANYIAKWNGSDWSALGSGMGGGDGFLGTSVSALAMSGSDVYAGGSFTMAGGRAATNIAKWN